MRRSGEHTRPACAVRRLAEQAFPAERIGGAQTLLREQRRSARHVALAEDLFGEDAEESHPGFAAANAPQKLETRPKQRSGLRI